jgi:hypothetical protein
MYLIHSIITLYNNLLFSSIPYLYFRYSFNSEFNQYYINFLNVDWFLHIVIVTVHLFLPPWRRLHEWPKHVNSYYIINLHSYAKKHLDFCLILYIRPTRNMEHENLITAVTKAALDHTMCISVLYSFHCHRFLCTRDRENIWIQRHTRQARRELEKSSEKKKYILRNTGN